MLCDHCVRLCMVFFIGCLVISCFVNVLCYVTLRLYIPQFVVCWSFGVAGFRWCSFCRLKHNCSVHVVCWGWGLMAV